MLVIAASCTTALARPVVGVVTVTVVVALPERVEEVGVVVVVPAGPLLRLDMVTSFAVATVLLSTLVPAFHHPRRRGVLERGERRRQRGHTVLDAPEPGETPLVRLPNGGVRVVGVSGDTCIVVNLPQVHVDTVPNAALPARRGELRNLPGRRGALHGARSECQPHHLGNSARVLCPSPELDAASVRRVQQVGVDALQRAGAPYQALGDVRQPSVPRHPVKDDTQPIEEGGGESARETSPLADADVGTVVLELVAGEHILAVPPVLEADQESLGTMPGDGDVTGLQPELPDDGVLQVPRRGTGRNIHGPSDQGTSLPVAKLAFNLEGGGDDQVVFLWTERRVPHPGHLGRSRARHGRRGRRRLLTRVGRRRAVSPPLVGARRAAPAGLGSRARLLTLSAARATLTLLVPGAEAEKAVNGVPAGGSPVVTRKAPEATTLSLAKECDLGGS